MNDADAPLEGPQFDSVTGAHPRALLHPQLDAALKHAVETDGRCSVFLFDVDFFKTVNDAYGHLRGDRVLREIAGQIALAIRDGDTLYRYGGDEFVVILPGTDRAEALRCAMQVTDAIRRHEFDGEPPLHLSISLGVATYPEDGTDSDGLLGCADRRNYLAKRRGRDSVVADDVETEGEFASSRLWDRDPELRTVHEFLTRLHMVGAGALGVAGEPGAGHTRFLAEIATIATLRGFTVLQVPPQPEALAVRPHPASRGVLLIADIDATSRIPQAVAAVRRADPTTAASGPAVLGLVYATSNGVADNDPPDLPVIAKVTLKPWSTAVLRIWLRNTLRGEPSRTLLSWVAAESGGLPAPAVRALDRLRGRNGLVPAPNGGWTVSSAVLGRSAQRTALPMPLTALIGREYECDRVVGLLSSSRLVTLVGTGGIGKTRLSLAVAAAVADRFDEGALFVPLADTTDGDQVVAAIAKSLRVTESPGQNPLEAVTDHLAESSLLLVLDNFEQVVESAPVIAAMLAAAPRVSALVTSRERLAIYGEQVYRVPPLSLPDLASLPAGADRLPRALAESPAIRLFDQRARAADPDFELTSDNLPVVTELCRRLDGLPLAIELAAARVDRWRPAALLDQLREHLEVRGRGPRDRPARQKTLRGAIDWSYALLAPADQVLFDLLAVFVGGGTVDAMRAVAPDIEDLTDRLELLVEKSLLVADGDDTDDGDRFRLLETIRVYAAERLARRPDAEVVHARHAEHFTAFVERCGAGLTGPDQATWARRLERDYGNVRTALAWLLGRGDAVLAARLCLGLWRYWHNCNNLAEGRTALAQLLATADALPAEVRARLLYAAAVLAARQDDHSTARALAHQSLRLAEAAGDRATTAQAHNALGIASVESGDYDRATGHFQQSLKICEELDQIQGVAIALGNLTKVALRVGDFTTADGHIRRCLELERAAGNTWGIVRALAAVGRIRQAQNDLPESAAALRESLHLSRTLGDVFGEATALHGLGLVAQAEGDREEALRLLIGALTRRHEVGDREDLAVSLDRVADLIAADDPDLAARLLAAAGELRLRHRLPDPPESDTRRSSALAMVRRLLDERSLSAAWEAGRRAPLDRVVDQVLDLLPEAH